MKTIARDTNKLSGRPGLRIPPAHPVFPALPPVLGLPILLLLVILAGCASTPAEIARDPQAWNGKTVTLRGTVGRGFSIPLTDFSVFLLEDGDGKVPVVALRDRTAGKKTTVKGEVWAFPERGMNEASTQAVTALGEFLAEHTSLEPRRMREVSVLILTAVGGLAEGLGQFWFVIEK